MKKRTKKTILVIIIILIFGLSSITYIIFSLGSFVNPNEIDQQQDDFNLEEYLYFEELTTLRKQELVQRGYTVVNANYKTGCCQDSIALIQQLPETFQFQVVVELIEADENSLSASSLIGTFDGIIEDKQDVLETVCRAVLSAPPDCGILFLNQNNSTN